MDRKPTAELPTAQLGEVALNHRRGWSRSVRGLDGGGWAGEVRGGIDGVDVGW